MAAPKAIIKVSPSPVLSLQPFTQSEVLLHLASGDVEVFNLRKSKSVFKVDTAHCNQVQKCKVHPENGDVMATVGFDGFLKVWDLKTMKLQMQFEDKTAKGIDAII